MEGNVLIFLLSMTLNLCTLLCSVAGSSASCFSSLTFPIDCVPGSRLRSSSTFWDPTFLFASQRPYAAEPEANFPSSAEPWARRGLTHLPAPLRTHWISCGCHKPLLVHHHWRPRQSRLFDAIAPSSLCMDFLVHSFNIPWSLHSFPSIWKRSYIILIHKIRKPHDSPASFRPIFLTSCVSTLLNASYYPVCSSFWSLTLFSLLARPVSA